MANYLKIKLYLKVKNFKFKRKSLFKVKKNI